MGKAPADQWYWKDWLADTELQLCSSATRGIWMNALCHMFFARPQGELKGTDEQLSQLLNCSVTEFVTLKGEQMVHDFAYCVTDAVTGIVTLRNRRMFEKGREKEMNRLRQQRRRESRRLSRQSHTDCHADVTLYSPSPNKEEKESVPVTPIQSKENHHVPYKEIRQLWIEILCPPCPIPREENQTWYKECKARWTSYPKAQEQGLEWCRRFFEKIKSIPFYMGENNRAWKVDIGWVWKQKNFWKIIERE